MNCSACCDTGVILSMGFDGPKLCGCEKLRMQEQSEKQLIVDDIDRRIKAERAVDAAWEKNR